jgi:hypothetical protein
VWGLRPRPAQPALLGPWLDALGIGGLWILALAALLVAQPDLNPQANFRLFLVLTAAINWPHFMASYRALYNSRGNIQTHRWAAIYMPALLLVYTGVAVGLLIAQGIWVPFFVLEYVGAVYLAWHYTGQAWGATVSFAHLDGVRLSDGERKTLRAVLRVFLLWHVCIYHARGHQNPLFFIDVPHASVSRVAEVATYLSHGAALAALAVFARIWSRSGKRIPIRMVIPTTALYLGYVLLMYRGGEALIILQFGHAAQYMVFLSRVELNRYALEARRPVWHALKWYFVLLAIGWVVFQEWTRAGAWMGGNPEVLQLVASAGALTISIHHYVIDSCIWKLTNPVVRRDLFRHLAPAQS